MKLSILGRILLLLTAFLAAWQVVVGLNGLNNLPMISYTVGFGIILIAVLLVFILGLEVLDSPIVVILSTLIPLSLSMGLVWQHLPAFRIPYLLFAMSGLLAIIITRLLPLKHFLPLFVLAAVHGLAGLTIFLLPLVVALTRQAIPAFALVGLGGGLIGVGGLMLVFLRAGRPLISRQTFLKIFPALLFLTTAAFVLGFSAIG